MMDNEVDDFRPFGVQSSESWRKMTMTSNRTRFLDHDEVIVSNDEIVSTLTTRILFIMHVGVDTVHTWVLHGAKRMTWRPRRVARTAVIETSTPPRGFRRFGSRVGGWRRVDVTRRMRRRQPCAAAATTLFLTCHHKKNTKKKQGLLALDLCGVTIQ